METGGKGNISRVDLNPRPWFSARQEPLVTVTGITGLGITQGAPMDHCDIVTVRRTQRTNSLFAGSTEEPSKFPLGSLMGQER